MISKSSTRKGSSLLFGRKGIVTGLFKIGGAIVKDVTNSSYQSSASTASGKDIKINKFVFILIILPIFITIDLIGFWWTILGLIGIITIFILCTIKQKK